MWASIQRKNSHLNNCYCETGGDEEKQLRREIAKICKLDLGFNGVKVQFEEKEKLKVLQIEI